MSSTLPFRAFLIERLTATAEEIFQVFDRTVVKYEEEATGFKREIESLRSLLQEKQQRTDLSSPSLVCKEEMSPESRIDVLQEDTEPRHIKEESPEHWAARQQAEEEEQVEQFTSVDVFDTSQSSISEQDDTDPSWSGCDSEDELSDDTKVLLPLDSGLSPQTLVQSQSTEDGSDGSESDVSDEFVQNSDATSTMFTEWDPIKLNNYKCLSCSKRFSYSQHLINHAVRMHSHDGSLLCPVCGMTLETTESLNFHLQAHKGSKFCYLCGRECSNIIALSDHMAIHTQVKLHRCPDCGNMFNRKSDLKIHMRIHTGEKPYCCSYCGKGFTASGHMWRHRRIHTGERPHRCDVCGRGFLQSAHLKYHLGTHTKATDVLIST